ncbi:MAG: 2-polyprenyl-3-methyl-6-methoxy-1,4-benzoquinone monooxygenase [Steroidobacteraceae bacterium]
MPAPDSDGRARLSPLDELLVVAGKALKTLFAPPAAARPNPADAAQAKRHAARAGAATTGTPELSDSARRLAAELMRVNHAGEIAAQALYHAQSLTARNAATRTLLQRAAREEGDHLAWCHERLAELDDRPSLLTPVWYAGSFAIGTLAGLMGDRVSLGFVAETERQVEGHLRGHLDRLPREDSRSRAIVEAMRRDETVHGRDAVLAGAAELPSPVRELMRATAKIMTVTAARL